MWYQCCVSDRRNQNPGKRFASNSYRPPCFRAEKELRMSSKGACCEVEEAMLAPHSRKMMNHPENVDVDECYATRKTHQEAVWEARLHQR